MQMILLKALKFSVAVCCSLLAATTSHAGLFEDDEARKAILDLRQKVETIGQELEHSRKSASDENASLGKSMLDLQGQIEQLKTELGTLRGSNETMMRELADIQRSQKDQVQLVGERLAKFEPVKVQIDGIEFLAEPVEKRDFEGALTVFRKGDFVSAQNLFETSH